MLLLSGRVREWNMQQWLDQGDIRSAWGGGGQLESGFVGGEDQAA